MAAIGLVLAAACASEAMAPGDAPPDVTPPGSGPPDPAPDAPPGDGPVESPSPSPSPLPPPLERIDWRGERARISTTTATVPRSELFALSDTGFVTRSGCGQGCDYAWRDIGGAVHAQRDRLFAATATTVAPDGRRALLVALDELETCVFDQGTTQVARGTLQLLDLATSASQLDLALRTNLWNAPAFTARGDWLFAAPNLGRDCFGVLGQRLASPPFDPPIGVDPAWQFVDAVDATRWLVLRDADLGVVDPRIANSFQVLADDPSRFDVSRGWIHVYLGFALLAEDVVSLPPGGGTRRTTLRDGDWFPFGVQGRWVRVCRGFHPDGVRDCRVVDAQGELAPVDLRAVIPPDRPDDAVLLVEGAVVYVGPLPEGGRAVQRVQFATGRRDVLHRGSGSLRSLGDGTAALLVQGDTAWLIDATRDELVAEHVRHVVAVPRVRVPGRRPVRQDDVAVLVLAPDAGRTTLVAVDARTWRAATLTDALVFTPRADGEFAFDDGCGQPWTTRHAGSLLDGLFQDAQQLFFVEQGQPAALWLVPIDLSAAPRKLVDLPGPLAACHAPLASPDGRRIAVAVDSGDGATTSITLSAGPGER